MTDDDVWSVEDLRRTDWTVKGDKPKRANKYNASPEVIDGYRFDSKAEKRRYLFLKGELEAGRITHLEPRPKPITIFNAFVDNEGNRVRKIEYTPDFTYRHAATGLVFIEDVKGGKATQTRDFKLRWKLLQAKYASDETVRLRITEA